MLKGDEICKFCECGCHCKDRSLCNYRDEFLKPMLVAQEAATLKEVGKMIEKAIDGRHVVDFANDVISWSTPLRRGEWPE